MSPQTVIEDVATWKATFEVAERKTLAQKAVVLKADRINSAVLRAVIMQAGSYFYSEKAAVWNQTSKKAVRKDWFLEKSRDGSPVQKKFAVWSISLHRVANGGSLKDG